MAITHLRFAKSTTRDLAERSRVGTAALRLGEPEAWHSSNGVFVIGIVAILAMLTAFALVWR